jgi:hypothetical protein
MAQSARVTKPGTDPAREPRERWRGARGGDPKAPNGPVPPSLAGLQTGSRRSVVLRAWLR